MSEFVSFRLFWYLSKLERGWGVGGGGGAFLITIFIREVLFKREN